MISPKLAPVAQYDRKLRKKRIRSPLGGVEEPPLIRGGLRDEEAGGISDRAVGTSLCLCTEACKCMRVMSLDSFCMTIRTKYS